jgi:hypothetical protein
MLRYPSSHQERRTQNHDDLLVSTNGFHYQTPNNEAGYKQSTRAPPHSQQHRGQTTRHVAPPPQVSESRNGKSKKNSVYSQSSRASSSRHDSVYSSHSNQSFIPSPAQSPRTQINYSSPNPIQEYAPELFYRQPKKSAQSNQPMDCNQHQPSRAVDYNQQQVTRTMNFIQQETNTMSHAAPPSTSKQQQRRLSYTPKTYQAMTSRAVEPPSPTASIKKAKPVAAAPPPSSKQQQQRRLSYTQKTYQATTSRTLEPTSPTARTERVKPASAAPPSSSKSSKQQQQRRLSYTPKTYQATTSRALEPSPHAVEEVEPAAIKYQRIRDTTVPVTIKCFIDDTPVHHMLVFSTASFRKVQDVIQAKSERYFSRRIEIGKICYVDANSDLVRLCEEEDWIECKYDQRKELYLRIDLIDVTDAGSTENIEQDIFAAYE